MCRCDGGDAAGGDRRRVAIRAQHRLHGVIDEVEDQGGDPGLDGGRQVVTERDDDTRARLAFPLAFPLAFALSFAIAFSLAFAGTQRRWLGAVAAGQEEGGDEEEGAAPAGRGSGSLRHAAGLA